MPTALFASTEETDQRLLESLREAGEALVEAYDWTSLATEHTFATVAATASYTLPTDFNRLISETAWNRDQYWLMRGSLGAAEWQHETSAQVVEPLLAQRFRINAGPRSRTLRLVPTPTLAEDLALEYISSNWLLDADNVTTKADVAADTDQPRVDERLLQLGARWRFMRSLGEQYGDFLAEAQAAEAKRFADNASPSAVCFSNDYSRRVPGLLPVNFPFRGYG